MENKKQVAIIIFISVICSVVISVIIILALSGNNGAMSIADFNISEMDFLETNPYSNTIRYEGEATITCKDTEGTYLVIYSEKLVNGGTYEKIGQTTYQECIVHNGKGTITTYDYGDDDKITRPNYEIELLGYRSFY